MMMKLSTALIACAMLIGCSGMRPGAEPHTEVLAYQDFGPQVIAHELIGTQWWQ